MDKAREQRVQYLVFYNHRSFLGAFLFLFARFLHSHRNLPYIDLPFYSDEPSRCIASLVQHMNLENDQELLFARLHMEELEALVASPQKEVCLLNTRLAATETMAHDVIHDLLGVKLDMTNYVNLIDQVHIQKLVVVAHQQIEELLAKEQEIFNLRKQIKDLVEEKRVVVNP